MYLLFPLPLLSSKYCNISTTSSAQLFTTGYVNTTPAKHQEIWPWTQQITLVKLYTESYPHTQDKLI